MPAICVSQPQGPHKPGASPVSAGISARWKTSGSGARRAYRTPCPRRTLERSSKLNGGGPGVSPGELKVNCPNGAREGGLGHWVLSFSGKYRAAGMTSHRAACDSRLNTTGCQKDKFQFAEQPNQPKG